MRTEDLERLLYRLNSSSNDIGGMINILQELLKYIDEICKDDGLKFSLIHAYTEAMQALSKVIVCNQALCQKIHALIEAYACCSSPGGSFGYGAQGSQRPFDEIMASKSAGEHALEKVSESKAQAASAFEDAGRDHDFDGTAGSPEKPCEGVPSHCSVCGGAVSAGA